MCQWYQCGCAQDQLQKLWYRELFCFILSQWVSPIWVTDLWIVIASLLCLSRSQAVYSVQCSCIHLFMVVVDVFFCVCIIFQLLVMLWLLVLSWLLLCSSNRASPTPSRGCSSTYRHPTTQQSTSLSPSGTSGNTLVHDAVQVFTRKCNISNN